MILLAETFRQNQETEESPDFCQETHQYCTYVGFVLVCNRFSILFLFLISGLRWYLEGTSTKRVSPISCFCLKGELYLTIFAINIALSFNFIMFLWYNFWGHRCPLLRTFGDSLLMGFAASVDVPPVFFLACVWWFSVFTQTIWFFRNEILAACQPGKSTLMLKWSLFLNSWIQK